MLLQGSCPKPSTLKQGLQITPQLMAMAARGFQGPWILGNFKTLPYIHEQGLKTTSDLMTKAPDVFYRCQATCKTIFNLVWHEAGSPNHHDDIVDSDQ